MKLLLAIAAISLGMTGSANAAIITYYATLTGADEAPPNSSPGTGFATFAYDNILHTLSINASFSGLQGTTTVAHIHSPTTTALTGTAGVATTTPTFAGFPSGVTSGTYSVVLDLLMSSSYNAAFVTNNGGTTATAEAAFVAGIAAGKAYLNIHTSAVPGGEIRGFLLATPEPSVGLLLIAPLAALVIRARKRA